MLKTVIQNSCKPSDITICVLEFLYSFLCVMKNGDKIIVDILLG